MMQIQVNKNLGSINALRYYIHKNYNTKCSNRNILCPLINRGLIRIQGEYSSTFLQGLITNDMRHLENDSHSIYTLFLNSKGRVLYDTIIYNWTEKNSFLIECDLSILGLLSKHLKLFRIKKKIEIDDFSNEIKPWVLLGNLKPNSDSNRIYNDPRLKYLGLRVLAPATKTITELKESIDSNIITTETDDEYKYLRYQLGVGEGISDLPPGACFPLEVNCDYLHGVSFHKGCYIGQELTARVHHTGVVRKRLMPIKFENIITAKIAQDTAITNEKEANIGKFKGHFKDFGLGLLRVAESLQAKLLKVSGHKVEVSKPNWWPIEAPKEKLVKGKL